MNSRPIFSMLLLIVLPALLAAAPVSASSGWLVLRDGQVLETQGAWGRYRPDGRFLIYLAPGETKPTLIEAWKVDIEKSSEATNSGKPPAPKKRAKVSFIDADILRNRAAELETAVADFKKAVESNDRQKIDDAFARVMKAKPSEDSTRPVRCALMYPEDWKARNDCERGKDTGVQGEPLSERASSTLNRLAAEIECARTMQTSWGFRLCLERIAREAR